MGEPAKTKGIDITDEVDTLINMVQLRPYLYNKQHKKYFDRELKQIAWQEIGKVSSMTVAEAKSKWAYLRDEFNRKKNAKTRSGSKASKTNSATLIFLKRMSFLEPFMGQRRKTSGNYSTTEIDGEISIEEIPGTVNCGDMSDAENVLSEPSNYSPKPNKRSKLKEPGQSHVLHERLLKVLETPQHEDELFGASVAASLMKLSPHKKAKAKVLIQQALFEVSFRQDSTSVGARFQEYDWETNITITSPKRQRVLSFSKI